MSWHKREYPLIGLAGLNTSVTCVLLLSKQHLYFMETGYIVVNVRKNSWRLIYTSILKFLFVITVGQCKYLIIYKSKIVCYSRRTKNKRMYVCNVCMRTWNIGMCDVCLHSKPDSCMSMLHNLTTSAVHSTNQKLLACLLTKKDPWNIKKGRNIIVNALVGIFRPIKHWQRQWKGDACFHLDHTVFS